jgi:carboxypeptidase C (cathepsin A)
MVMRSGFVFRTFVSTALLAFSAGLAFADDDGRPANAASERPSKPPESAAARTEPKADTEARPTSEPHRLPPDAVSRQTIEVGGRTLSFKATAGTIRLTDMQGAPQADVAVIAYQLDGTEPSVRPVTFAFNGGPGTASGWLQLGAVGPWRLPMNGAAVTSSAAPVLTDNSETWLDFTDLVFIDPPGTGYSRIIATGDQARHRYWSIDGDIAGIAETIRLWLENNGRVTSPKFIVGESYGGFRAPKLVRELQRDHGIGVRGIVMISPVLDFDLNSGFINPFGYLARLPSFAATVREAQSPVNVNDLADVESYAMGEYLSDFLHGERDAAAVSRMSERVATLAGLDAALVRKYGGRIDGQTFRREFDRLHGKVTSMYDATVSGFDPTPLSPYGRFPDPLTDALDAPVTSAMIDLITHRLGWRPDGHYILSNLAVNRAWDWGRGQPEAASDLRAALAFDPQFEALITHGITDLVTPYFGSKLILNQIQDFGASGRLAMKVYSGGHMHYTRDESRKALHEDARRMVQGR